jgi:hypothetical protein
MKLVADRFGVGESLDDTKRITHDTILAHPKLKRGADLWKFGRGRCRPSGEGSG